jgi:transcriptional regulator with GAF, ATPase, and Fis domain
MVKTDYLNTLEAFITMIGHQAGKMKVLTSILPCALAVSQADVGALLVVEAVDAAETHNLTLVAQHGMPAEVIKQLTSGNLKEPLQTGQQIWVKLQSLKIDMIQALLRHHKLRCLLSLPLQFNGHILGAIVLGARRADSPIFEPETRQRLANLAYLSSLFLDHIRLEAISQTNEERDQGAPPNLVQEANATPSSDQSDDLEHLLSALMSAEEEVVKHNKDLGLLDTLSTEMGGSLHLSHILNSAIGKTITALQAKVGWCYLFRNGVLTLSAHQGLSGRYVEGMKHLNPGNGVEGMAFTRNEPILRDGLLFHSGRARELVQQEGLRSVAAVPLQTQDSPFGVLAVAAGEDRVWSSRDERMLASIGQRVSQAIRNAQIFDEIRYKAQALENRNTMLQRTNTELIEEFETMKTQLREILRMQERAWTYVASGSHGQPPSYGIEVRPSNSEIASALRRALEIISAA